MEDILTADSFLIYCAKHYNNPQCGSDEEFLEDLMRLKYIKKLITRYMESGELKERLILNHIIVLSNVFAPKVLCKIIWLKMPDTLPYVKPFLIFLNLLPDKIYNVGEVNVIDTTLVPMDQGIIDALRKI
jgi:adenylate kinase family enzyme